MKQFIVKNKRAFILTYAFAGLPSLAHYNIYSAVIVATSLSTTGLLHNGPVSEVGKTRTWRGACSFRCFCLFSVELDSVGAAAVRFLILCKTPTLKNDMEVNQVNLIMTFSK